MKATIDTIWVMIITLIGAVGHTHSHVLGRTTLQMHGFPYKHNLKCHNFNSKVYGVGVATSHNCIGFLVEETKTWYILVLSNGKVSHAYIITSCRRKSIIKW